MSQLKELQIAIQSFVTTGLGADEFIDATKAIDARERIQVYRTAYYLRLIEVLKDDYPHLYQSLGEKKFGILVRDYLAAYPPRSFSVHHVGRFLYSFMCEQGHYPAGYLELAQIDSELSRLYFMPYEAVLDQSALSDYLLQKGKLELIAAHAIVTVGSVTSELKLIDSQSQSLNFILWRKDYVVYYKCLSPFESCLLRELEGESFLVDICEMLVDTFGEKDCSDNIIKLLQFWTAEKLFADKREE